MAAEEVTTEGIVRALAARNAPLDREEQCTLCGSNTRWRGPFHLRTDDILDSPKEHDPTCPWRMAREWVKREWQKKEAGNGQ